MKKILTLIILLSLPSLSYAMEISGWIPYWKVKDGTKDAREHLNILTEINPFTLVVTKDGGIKDMGKMNKSNWTRLFKEARAKGVPIIPTIMTSDTQGIHAILSDKDKRNAHIEHIVALVKKGKYDGIDIDYEGKKAETNPYFAAFLTELKQALGNKTLACTIEARTPPESLYTVIPKTLAYANDFPTIGKVCDQVRIMTYDQQRADIRLNAAKNGNPYIPVADSDWVEKVIQFTIETIPKEKVMIGVATYGREWEIEVSPNRFGKYTNQWSVTHEYALEFADKINIEPLRNKAGELSYTYFPKKSPFKKLTHSYNVPRGTDEAYEAAQKALAYANATGKTAIVNVVWWSDATAIESKVDLAERLGVRGISIFKIDGTEDKRLWNILP